MALPVMKDLLEAGVHFGHQTKKWDPRMKPYIFQERNGIHIIDLVKTLNYIKSTYEAIKQVARDGGNILFVGTKKQASQSIKAAAEKCGMFYVSSRWLGGTLTNFATIKKSIARLKKIERMEVDDTFKSLPKKEVILLLKEKEKLEKNFSGIKDMEGTPDMMFIIDPEQEHIAIAEAKKLNIPLVAIVDTNCNPEIIDYIIPGNDDAIRAINLFTDMVANAVIEGQNEAGKEILSQEENASEASAVEEEVYDNSKQEEAETIAENYGVKGEDE